MQKILRRRAWTCGSCLRKQQRHNSTATATAVAQGNTYEDVYLYGSQKLQTDDNLLRNVFNSKPFWREFSQTAKSSSGLIGNKHLTTPRGFQRFAETSLQKCKMLVDRTLAASSVDEYKAIPRDLDRLSDLLCRVIDLSDFMRSIHPDQDVCAAATGSYAMMFQYMNELNTTTGLNEQLRRAWAMPEVQSFWSEEEKMVAQILMKDFAKSGIDLPAKQREEFVSLSNEIAQVGTDFINRMDHAKDFVALSSSQLDGVDPSLVRNMSSWKKARIPVLSPAAKLIMSAAKDSNARRELYVAERTASKQTIRRLEELLLRRAKLAKLTGYANFAEMTLVDKMSKTPEAVNNFLQSLNSSNKGQVQKELDQLLQVNKSIDPDADRVSSWDHAYLLNKLYQHQARNAPRTSKSRLHESSRSYFALGHVMQGLSSLFESLYGVRFVPKETKLGEVWNDQVRRLNVLNDKQEHIATIYCDLFTRPGKLPNPAHFTLVCSREVSQEEIVETSQNEPLNDGMPTLATAGPSGEEIHYQIPVIALVCDFPDNTASSLEPSLLSLHSVTTLFHEMGHAIHSILGRTTLQGIAGTRCATDFAELPSVLMEYFATDPSVLKMFARHWKTDAAMPDEMFEAMKREMKDRAEKTGGWDNENQILMAMLDQAYHSSDPVQALLSGQYDTTAAFHQIWNTHGSTREPMETSWQGFFGHLYGYGATYYSYLFDRAIARQVWRAVFRDGIEGGAVDRAAGERYKEEVLRWGGGRDPWKCLEGLMGDGKGVLAEGGEAAMLEVGKWGVGAGADGASP